MFDIFLIFAQNIDCGYRLELTRGGCSNEYPQFMFWSKNKKKWVYPSIPQFCYIKWGIRGYLVGVMTVFHDFKHSMIRICVLFNILLML